MFNKTKRVFALLLAAILVFSLVGCKKTVAEESSGGVIIEEVIEYVTESGDSAGDNDNQSGTQNPTGGNSNNNNNNSNTQNPSASNLINNNVDPEKYRGKTIKFGATIDPKNDESGPVVANFEKKYGIKVQVDLYDQNNFSNEILAKITAGKGPDIVRVNGDFPTCMGYLQSLDAAKLDYNDPIWNQATFKLSTFGGSPYICDTVNNIWAEIDIAIYSKSLLKRAGANTPEEYDKAGKWTWDAYFDICRKVKAIPGNEHGGSVLSRENYIYGTGAGLIQFENGKFKSGVNQRTQEAMVKFCTAWKEGLLSWGSTDDLAKGAIGITTAPAWVLKKTGAFQGKGYNLSDLGFYYLPRWDENSDYGNTGMVRGWGICRGATQPVAAGIFMREYLDVANYDTSNTFISKEAEEFFFRITSIDYSNWNPQIIYMHYQNAIAGSDVSYSEFYMAMSEDPAQVGTVMAAVKGTMEKAANNINKFVEQNTGHK